MEIRGIKGFELAEKANIHSVTVSKILNKKSPQVSLVIVQKLAIALGVTIADLADEKALYPERDQKILAVREQFEKYGYDSADVVIGMIPNLSKQLQDVKGVGQTINETLRQQQVEVEKSLRKKKKVA